MKVQRFMVLTTVAVLLFFSSLNSAQSADLHLKRLGDRELNAPAAVKTSLAAMRAEI